MIRKPAIFLASLMLSVSLLPACSAKKKCNCPTFSNAAPVKPEKRS